MRRLLGAEEGEGNNLAAGEAIRRAIWLVMGSCYKLYLVYDHPHGKPKNKATRLVALLVQRNLLGSIFGGGVVGCSGRLLLATVAAGAGVGRGAGVADSTCLAGNSVAPATPCSRSRLNWFTSPAIRLSMVFNRTARPPSLRAVTVALSISTRPLSAAFNWSPRKGS